MLWSSWEVNMPSFKLEPRIHQTTTARIITGIILIFGVTASVAFTGRPVSQEPVRQDNEAIKEAEKVAEKVKQKAERTERAEGRQDLVKDLVIVRVGDAGQAVIEQHGEASYYGPGFHGRKTANGETFDQNQLTAAHPTLPLGSTATVTNLETGDFVDVQINDRGPYVKGRDIDVSKRAAKELGMTKGGIAPVRIEAKVPPIEKENKIAKPLK
jgi:rare lipoprotein A (peptidoglycan hydrolase)